MQCGFDTRLGLDMCEDLLTQSRPLCNDLPTRSRPLCEDGHFDILQGNLSID